MCQAITSPRSRGWPAGFLLGISAGLILSTAPSQRAMAQDEPREASLASLEGRVIDARTDRPIVGATVTAINAGSEVAETVTDPEGRFLFAELKPGEHTIRLRFGGRPVEPWTIRLPAGHHTEILASVVLDDATRTEGAPVAELPPLEVQIEGESRPGKLRGFYERRGRAHGHFISAPEIRERAPLRTSDLMRGVPGLIVTRDPGGRPGIRIARSRGCAVEFYVDGAPAPGLSIDDIPPGDIDGLEIYRAVSEVPVQYRRPTTCAAILIWTRNPGGP